MTDKEEPTDLPPMPALKDNKVKEGKGLKNFNSRQFINQTSNIISTNKSRKQFMQIKNEIRQILYLSHQHNKTTKKVYSIALNKSLFKEVIESGHYNNGKKYDCDKR